MSGLEGSTRGGGAFDTHRITLKAQRTIACNFPNQTKHFFLDEITNHLVDTIHRFVWSYTRSKKRADYIVKQLLKINIKLHVIVSSGALGEQQQEDLSECRNLMHQTALRFIRQVLGSPRPLTSHTCLEKIQAAIKTAGEFARIVSEKYLSKKTVNKLIDVVMFFVDEELLTALLSNQPPYAEMAREIAHDLQDSIDRGTL